MNLLSHVTPTEVPFWIMTLMAGFALGALIALALVGWLRRKG